MTYPTWHITPDGSLYFYDKTHGAEIFFPDYDYDPDDKVISCVCGKDGEMMYYEEFEIGTNISIIQKWALDKMNYTNE